MATTARRAGVTGQADTSYDHFSDGERRSTRLSDETPAQPPTQGAPRPAHVVLVPGLGLDARAWSVVRARLTGRSLVVTLPSMGRRAAPGADLHVEEQGRRLIGALPRSGDLVLVGHSASCPVVVDVAMRTCRVRGLVLVGPVTDPTARTWPRMLGQWVRTATREHLWELTVLAPQYLSTGPVSMARGMSQIRRYRTHVALARLEVPTYVIRGQHDLIASARWCAELAASPLTEQLCVPGAAHMVPLTHPHVIASIVEHLRDGAGAPSLGVVRT